MKKNDVRNKFTKYFTDSGHTHVPSSSLIPHDDPTLLFNNAGMNQFKNVFLGLETRDFNKAVTVQKCVRAGGKHNDLDNVGFTARHHTFFEMLGNFSFGDYFKKEAIHYAWDFLTNELQLPKDRLYPTVFESDDEAFEIWHKQEGVAKDRIYRFGEDDNFWRMGKTGPCGPCSEIFFDMGPEIGGDPKKNVMGGDGDRYMEVWNLVFMQYNEDESGKLNPLPKPSVDTGAGLERLTAVLQNELSNYHTDDFMRLMASAQDIVGLHYDKSVHIKDPRQNEINVALRVLADHARTTAFLIADGVLPSNEGRGYVLRRIMRRALRYGRQLDNTKSFLPVVAQKVISEMSAFYPELQEKSKMIISTIKDEEVRFLKTLDQGTEILDTAIKKLQSSKESNLSGEVAFRLYDTYGFPFDLTQLMLAEANMTVNPEEFKQHMETAKEKARSSWKGHGLSENKSHLIKVSQQLSKEYGPTPFEGYNSTVESSGQIIFLSNGTQTVDKLSLGESGLVALDKTCFYAESGGQAGDLGLLSDKSNQAEVHDCIKQGDIFFLKVKVTQGEIKNNQKVKQQVCSAVRRKTTQHHSATHLLQAALRQILGDHVTQSGSHVDYKRLRFDFTHNQPLTVAQIQEIEDLVNQQIEFSICVDKKVMSHKDAIAQGALALFGEKYGDEVRVLKMGDFSTELCGGTHVDNTSQILAFKIVSESGVSSGVRRIEALAGSAAIKYLKLMTEENLKVRQTIGAQRSWTEEMDSNDSPIISWIEKQKKHFKDLEQKIQSAQSQQIDVNQLVAEATPLKSGQGGLVVADVEMDDRKFLSALSDRLMQKLQKGIVVVIGKGEKSNPIIVCVSKGLTKEYHAGNILKSIAAELGGKGGGRPDFAQGAAPNRDLKKAKACLQSFI